MKRGIVGIIAAVCFALALLPGPAFAGDEELGVADAASSAAAQGAEGASRSAAPDEGGSSRSVAETSEEKVLQSEFALLKADGWLYRANEKGKALEGGRTWSGANPLDGVKELFVDADVPVLGYDSQSGLDYAHPAVNLSNGAYVRKVRASLALRGNQVTALSGLEVVRFKTDGKGNGGCRLIGANAFAGSPVKTIANLEKCPVGEVGACAFAGCRRLVEVVLPEACVKLGENAFSGCSSLASVTLRAKSVVELGNKAVFSGSPLYNPFADDAHVYVPRAVHAAYLGNGVLRNQWLRYKTKISAMPNIADAHVKAASAEYTGKKVSPEVIVQYGSEKLEAGVDYKTSFSNNTNAGVAWVKVKGTGKYEGSKRDSFGIKKAGNELSAKVEAVKPDYFAVQYEDTVVEHPISVEGANGKVSYKLVDGSHDGSISIDGKTGDLTIAKGTPEGVYPVKVKVKASGDGNHRAASKKVSFDVEIDESNSPPSAFKFMAIAQREYDEGIADGSEHWGDSKYWRTFVGKYQSWCSEFVGWCLIEAGLERGVTMPKNASYAKAYYNFYKNRPDLATIHVNDGSYEPQPGDIVLQVKSGNRFWHTEMITWSDGYNYGGISGGTHVVTTSRSLGNKQYYYFITINWDAIAEMAGE